MQESVVATTIVQAGVIGNQGDQVTSRGSRHMILWPSREGRDPMVVGHCFRLIRRDMGASAKRKENQSPSSSKKNQKTSTLYGFQGWGRGYQG